MPLPSAVVEAGRLADEALVALEQDHEDTAAGASTLDELVPDDQHTLDADAGDQAVDMGAAPEAQVLGDDQVPLSGSVDYEHKYKTLMGKYKAEGIRLSQERDAALGQVRVLSSMPAAETLPADPAPVAITDEDIASASKRYLEKQEIDDFGEPLLDMHSRVIRGIAEEVAGSQISRLEARISQFEQQAVEQASSGALEEYWVKLEAALPGSRETNDNDPLFHDFLDTIDPLSNHPYRYLGEVAMGAGDVGGMVRIHRDYAIAYGKAPSDGIEAEAPPSEAPALRVKPGQKRGRAPKGGEPATQVIKKSTVEQFFSDLARGKYRDRKELAKKREAEIDSAFAEGRIIPG